MHGRHKEGVSLLSVGLGHHDRDEYHGDHDDERYYGDHDRVYIKNVWIDKSDPSTCLFEDCVYIRNIHALTTVSKFLVNGQKLFLSLYSPLRELLTGE